MRRLTTLICTSLFLVSLHSAGLADETADRLSPPLTPIYVAPSPRTSSNTYYPPAAAADTSPLTVAASTPPRWETVANYVSGALDNLATAQGGTVTNESPAAAVYTTDAADSPITPELNSPITAEYNSPITPEFNSPITAEYNSSITPKIHSNLIESPSATASTPGLSTIPAQTEYGAKTSVFSPAASGCSTCTKVYAPATTVYNPATPAFTPVPVITSPAAAGCCPPTGSACSPPPPSVFSRRVVACRPVVETASMPRSYYVGKGMIGQPVVYVPNQPVRNALRWFFP